MLAARVERAQVVWSGGPGCLGVADHAGEGVERIVALAVQLREQPMEPVEFRPQSAFEVGVVGRREAAAGSAGCALVASSERIRVRSTAASVPRRAMRQACRISARIGRCRAEDP
jgi:hypothetical protein